MTKQTEAQANEAIEMMKAAVKDMFLKGADSETVFKCVAKLVGNETARFIIASIALDNGRVEETKKYLASF